jgi:hypothetical protein
MNLVPPAELHTILSDEGYGPLNECDSTKLAEMIEAGLNSWNSFHKKFHGEHKISQLEPGQATWSDLQFFAMQYAKGKPVEGYRSLSFERLDKKEIVSRESNLKVLELGDGTLMACAEVGDMPVQGPPGSRILPGGLNVPAVIEALRSVGFPDQPTGAAYLRYSEELKGSAFQRPLGLLGICGGTVVAASSPSRRLARRVSRDARLDDSRARCRDEAARSGGCKLITGDIRRLSSKQGDCCSSDC